MCRPSVFLAHTLILNNSTLVVQHRGSPLKLAGIVHGLLDHGAVYDAGYASSPAWQPTEQRAELLKGWWENEWPR